MLRPDCDEEVDDDDPLEAIVRERCRAYMPGVEPPYLFRF